MNYKNYKIHHSRGKSDTNFYQEQTILNCAYSGLKVLRVSIVSDLAQSAFNLKKSKIRLKIKVNPKIKKKKSLKKTATPL